MQIGKENTTMFLDEDQAATGMGEEHTGGEGHTDEGTGEAPAPAGDDHAAM